MRLQLVMDRRALTAADDNGDGVDDVTGEPVDVNAPAQEPPPTIETPPVTDVGAQGAEAPPADRTGLRPLHALIIVEDTWTGDGRWFVGGTIGWRDLPLPVMAQDVNLPAHMEAGQVGIFDRIERVGAELHGYGWWDTTERADYFHERVGSGFLRGISADLDDFEYDLLVPAEMMTMDPTGEAPAETVDGEVVIPMTEPRMRVTKSRLMGATIVPFPALQEAYIENPAEETPAPVALAASITGQVLDVDAAPLVASGYTIDPPLNPPAAWLTEPCPAGTPMTITDEGRIYGRLADFGSCHVGFPGECVTPPSSTTSYAHFHLGEIICDDGTRLSCGKITMDTGHAGLSLDAPRTIRHYDDTGTAIADVRCGEDDDGIWIAGALRPGITPLQVRALMAADLSGDWRYIGGNLELVAALAVNVPGYHKPRYASIKGYEHEGRVASLVASIPVVPRREHDDDMTAFLVDAIAASIGRTPDARIAEMRALVHGGS
jgi:hypothetical protein